MTHEVTNKAAERLLKKDLIKLDIHMDNRHPKI